MSSLSWFTINNDGTILTVNSNFNVEGNLNVNGGYFNNSTALGGTGGGGSFWSGVFGGGIYYAGAGATVGIGLTNPNPAYRLDVAGDVNISGDYYRNGVLFTGGGGATLWSETGGKLSTDVNVGINTSDPQTSLHVNDSTPTSNVSKGIRVGVGSTFMSMNFISPVAGTPYFLMQTKQSAGPITTGNVSLNPEGGFVGIGRTNPGFTLDVSGNVNFTGELFKNGVLIPTGGGAGGWINDGPDVYYPSSGNVGIGGIPLSGTRLQVYGNLNLNGTSDQYRIGGSSVLTRTTLGSTVINSSLTSVGNLTSLTVDTNTLVVVPGFQRVGIGLTNPSYKLDVSGSINGTDVLVNGTPIVSGNTLGATITQSSLTTVGTLVNLNVTGNVGIGTNNPGGKLDVFGNVNDGLISRITNLNSGTGAFGALQFIRDTGLAGLVLFQNSTGRTTEGGSLVATIRNDSGNLRIQGSPSVVGTWFTSTGNVGIGTTNPDTTLDVRGSINIGSREGAQNTSGSDMNIGQIVIGNSFGPIIRSTYPNGTFTDSTRLEFYTSGNNVSTSDQPPRMVITGYGQGNVGIGTTNPGSLLHVNGTVRANQYNIGATSTEQRLVYTAAMTGGSYTSDHFYPLVFTNTSIPIYFEITMPSQGSTASFNSHSITGFIRGGGFTDLPNAFDIFHIFFDTNERSIGGIYRGTASYVGVAVYLRGGMTYTIKANVSATFSDQAITSGDSTFAVKNASMVDVVGTSANISLMWNGITAPSGRYIRGPLAVENNGQSAPTLLFRSGPSNTNPWTISANTTDSSNGSLRFINGVNERMTISAAGNVGIGTTNAQDRLVVSGAIRSNGQSANFNVGGTSALMDITTDTKIVRIGSVLGGDSNTGTQGEVSFFVNNTERMRINAIGNVGINSTNPGYTLDVAGNINFTGSLLQNGVTFSPGGSSQWVTSGSNIYYNTGSVGIGTTNPQSKFHNVTGTKATSFNTGAVAGGVVIEEKGTTGNKQDAVLSFWTTESGPSVTTYGAARITGGWETASGTAWNLSALSFQTHSGNSSAWSTDMVIRGGNVGIGTLAPRLRLHVIGTNGVGQEGNGILVNSYANSTTASTQMTEDGDNLLGQNSAGLAYLYWRVNGTKYVGTVAATQAIFTGQHMSFSETISRKDVGRLKGLIVVSTGKHKTLFNAYDNTSLALNRNDVNNSHPMVELSSRAYQKSVYGVVSNYSDQTPKRRTDGTVEYDEDPQEDGLYNDLHERIRVNSIGEGSIWVTNENGPIENGDYIVSSSLPGYGMKQSDDVLRNYTVAKSTIDCDFQRRQVVRMKLKHEILRDETGAITKKIITNPSGIPQFEPCMVSDLRNLKDGEEDEYVVEDEYDVKYFYKGEEVSMYDYEALYSDENKRNSLLIAAFIPCTYHCG